VRGNTPPDGAVFLSYARKDGSENAQWLETELRRAGLITWRDTNDIDGAADFGVQIEKAIRHCSAMVLCVTADVTRPESFVRREIAFALAERRRVIVARFAEVTPPIPVVTNTFVDFHASRDGALKQLLQFLGTGDRDAETPAQNAPNQYLEALYREVVDALDEMVLLPASGRRGRLLEITGVVTRSKTSPGDDVLSSRFRVKQSPIMGMGVQQAFQRSDGRLAIVGGPGSGKTTTMLALTRDLLSGALTEPGRSHFPVLVSAATWGAEGRVETDLLSWLQREVPTLASDLPELIATGRLLLLIDGLDEVPTERGRSVRTGGSVRAGLVAQLSAVPSVVVASRPSAFESAYPGLGMRCVLELRPLTDGQIDEYLSDVPAVAAVLGADSVAREIARTPLMLTMLCSTLDLAATKDLRGLATSEARDLIMRAFVESRLLREVGTARTSDGELERRLGLLAMADAGGGGNRNLFSLREARSVLGEDRLALALDMHVLLPAGTEAVRFFHIALRDHFAFQCAMLAASDPSPGVRDSAAWALWQIPDARAFDLLVAMLDDPYPYARGSAAAALGNLGDHRAIPALSRLLADDTDVASMYGDSIGEVARWAIRQIRSDPAA
jgi:hypothetical protein